MGAGWEGPPGGQRQLEKAGLGGGCLRAGEGRGSRAGPLTIQTHGPSSEYTFVNAPLTHFQRAYLFIENTAAESRGSKHSSGALRVI